MKVVNPEMSLVPPVERRCRFLAELMHAWSYIATLLAQSTYLCMWKLHPGQAARVGPGNIYPVPKCRFFMYSLMNYSCHLIGWCVSVNIFKMFFFLCVFLCG